MGNLIYWIWGDNLSSLLILWEFHVIHPNSHILVHPCPPLTPAAHPQNILKIITKQSKPPSKQKQEQNKKHPPNLFNSPSFPSLQSLHPNLSHLFIGGIGSLNVSYVITFCSIVFPRKCSLQHVTGLVQCLWFLVHDYD